MPQRLTKAAIKKLVGKGLVLVAFYDHSQGCGRAVFTESAGWILEVKDREILHRPWRTPKEPEIDNSEGDFAILIDDIEAIILQRGVKRWVKGLKTGRTTVKSSAKTSRR